MRVGGEHVARPRYLRHRFPPDIISHAVWLHGPQILHELPAMSQDLLAERGHHSLSYETAFVAVVREIDPQRPDYALTR